MIIRGNLQNGENRLFVENILMKILGGGVKKH